MTTRVDLDVDARALDREVDRVISGALRAGTTAVRVTTRKLEQAFEDVTRGAVPGRLWRAWKSESFPRADIPAYAPTGTVFVNGGRRSQGAIRFWTQPGVNRARSGYWLAVPLPAAGARGAARDLTPGEWERRTGTRLIFVYRGAGRPALLVAEGTFAKNGSTVFRNFTAARQRGGQTARVTVPIFVLIPFQRFANRVALGPVIARHEGILAREFERRLARVAQLGVVR